MLLLFPFAILRLTERERKALFSVSVGYIFRIASLNLRLVVLPGATNLDYRVDLIRRMYHYAKCALQQISGFEYVNVRYYGYGPKNSEKYWLSDTWPDCHHCYRSIMDGNYSQVYRPGGLRDICLFTIHPGNPGPFH